MASFRARQGFLNLVLWGLIWVCIYKSSGYKGFRASACHFWGLRLCRVVVMNVG